jgi:oligopeptide/dipeptide ABC transporter ATP-binding protein
MTATNLLTVEGLSIDATRPDGSLVRLVDGIGLTISPGERVALVGESGSGKSVTARAILGLDPGLRVSGSVRFDGRELVGADRRTLASVRGRDIGMVFQDPLSALDPLMTIGDQIAQPLRARGVRRIEALAAAERILEELGVDDARRRMRSYPHEFSGGMRQRVVLAMALVGEPRLLIADEPTTALDVRVQAQVMQLLTDVAASRRLAVLFITHDVGVVGDLADRTVVMYSGRTVETAPVADFFRHPAHPYTRGLLAAVPRLDDGDRLVSLPGAPPRPESRPAGCAFADRCRFATDTCHTERPELRPSASGGEVACHLVPETIGAAS